MPQLLLKLKNNTISHMKRHLFNIWRSTLVIFWHMLNIYLKYLKFNDKIKWVEKLKINFLNWNKITENLNNFDEDVRNLKKFFLCYEALLKW